MTSEMEAAIDKLGMTEEQKKEFSLLAQELDLELTEPSWTEIAQSLE